MRCAIAAVTVAGPFLVGCSDDDSTGNNNVNNTNQARCGDGVQVANLDQVSQISVGYAHACALRDNGSLWCWGTNTYGGLGNGESELYDTPQLVAEP